VEAGQDVDVQFGKRFKDARGAKGWSQAEMAKLLGQKGIRVYDSTIAKIEAGDRPVKLAELVAAAELFEVGIDTLLQRDVRPRSDRIHTFRVVGDTAVKSSAQIIDMMSALRDRVGDLSAFDGLPARGTLLASCERAYALLAEAEGALNDVSRVALRNMGKELGATTS
jgi:transcriptional regulator with XRE-family HTH domain